MKNVISYIEKYGDKTFKQKSIGEIDYAILSILSYMNYDGILSFDRVKLGDALNRFFKKYSDKELSTHGLGIKDAYKIAKSLMNTKRFKDLEVYNYYYITNHEIQFSAMFIDISKDETFISIEGTDDEVVAWKEDFQLSYQFPIPAQRECIKYLKKNISLLNDRKYIVSGHSKGGNLALVGCMFLSLIKQHKIKAIYSFDGPGLSDKEYRSRRFQMVKNKYKLILPNYSVVGVLFMGNVNKTIVSSYKKGVMAHSVYNWRVFDDKFYEAEQLSAFSRCLDMSVKKWTNTYDINTRRQFVEDLFDVFDRCNIKTLYKINVRDLKELAIVAREAKNISPESKTIIKEFLKILFNTIKEDTFPFTKSKEDSN